ncbi:hypothetical protein I302_101069 [Kwoniella bestiolae CBS 10118]|uniref:Major facilitator superfamily (MFS) profile domain-containing protein n=1 Tax=Kwoniella bestiolae CBS 10118 TaxID=1296100 RepID=A0A1B9G6V7_9TREE|nr:hypothetical protein I302_04445 [Kwoniella bestiolae CBS 10118]OCF26756.1 hypothetical protein I302_04445 [Kwoniella bestiolae CBS 10118]
MGFKNDWAQATPYLGFCVFTFCWANVIFGLDTSTFGSLQVLPSWLSRFGTNGALTVLQKAIANSVVYVGRIAGTLTFEPIAEKYGYKTLLAAIAGVQIVSVVVQLAAGNFNTFIAGRTISYIAVGWIDGTIASYASEVAPAALRGFFSGLLAPMANLASVWGAGMCQHYAKETRKIGWMVPISVQLIPVVAIIICWPFAVESPRWLAAHGKPDQALRALKKLRRKEDVAAGVCEAELEAITYAIEYDRTHATARWMDLFSKTAYKQFIYTILFFFFYPSTGNAFYNAYGTTFFKAIGLGDKAFTYAILCQLMGMVGGLTGLFLTDRVGRRPLLIIGSALLVLFDGLAAGLGSKAHRTTTENNVVVACWTLMLWSAKLSWATHAYIVVPEMGGIRMRKKLVMVGTTVDVLGNWLWGFSSPYIQKHQATAGAKIGYLFMGFAAMALLFAIFAAPELKGRSLEEVDELFSKFRWGWEYKGYVTTGVGAAVAQAEHGQQNEGKANDHVENGDDENEKEVSTRVQVHAAAI